MIVLQLLKTSVGATWALRQMRELAEMGVEVHVLLPAGGKLVDIYKKAGVVVHYWTPSIRNILSSGEKIRQVVNEIKPDLIHSHFVLTTIIMRMALRQSKIPRIFQVPGPLHLENVFFRNLDIYLAQETDYWVGSCNWTNERYKKSGISENRLFLSYYGSDIKYKRVEKTDYIHKLLHLDKNAIVVGMVAYMYAPKRFLGQTRGLKGHEDFIDAIAILEKKYPNIHGVCVGGAWDDKNYEKKVHEYAKKKTDKVHFLGTRNDIPELYSDMFCVVHPSLSENLGGAAESLAIGVPTIATNIGGFPDIVRDKETGLLVPPHSPEAISEAIISLIEKKYDAMTLATNGMKLVDQLLDIKNTAKSMYEIYKKILTNV